MSLETSPHIPPEILQSIFRELEFFDLLRCQQVCQAWRASVPGDDPELRATLFLEAPLIDEEEDEDEDEEEGEEEEEEEEEESVPRLIIRLKLPLDLAKPPGELPYLSFGLEVLFREEAEWMTDEFESSVDFDVDTVFHPMIENIESYMHFINFDFHENDVLGRASLFFFHTMKELKEKTRRLETHEYEDGSWRDMLMCTPAVDKVQVEYRWATGPRRSYNIDASAGTGVTVGQVIDTMRDMLACAPQDVESFAGHLEMYCRDCDREIEAGEWA